MKIAINCIYFQPKGGGIKEYIYNLVTQLSMQDTENEYIIYVLEEYINYAKAYLSIPFKIKSVPYKGHGLINRIMRSLFEGYFWRKEEKKEKWDIFHSPFFHSPQLKNTKIILTVHDLRFYRFPETYEFFRSKFLKIKVRKSVIKANVIIAISQFTKNELIMAYNLPAEKITVIHEAINKKQFSSQSINHNDIPTELLNSRFLLTVSQLEPRKNYNRLILAFEELKKCPNFSDLALVIVGQKGWKCNETLELINGREDVYYLDFVSHNLLIWLYKNCDLFVFPSYYEGFGFPPLEAASLGAVSAVSNASSIPEVCGDIAFYFDPFDYNDIARTIKTALEDKGEYFLRKQKIPKQLEKFSWKKNVSETLDIYRKVIKFN